MAKPPRATTAVGNPDESKNSNADQERIKHINAKPAQKEQLNTSILNNTCNHSMDHGIKTLKNHVTLDNRDKISHKTLHRPNDSFEASSTYKSQQPEASNTNYLT